MRVGDMGMTSPIIIFNPTGLTDDQVKLIKEALDEAYRVGYETAKEFYQLKFNTEPTRNPQPQTWITGPGMSYGVEMNNCSQNSCDHMYVTAANKANSVCGKCGISFDKWHG